MAHDPDVLRGLLERVKAAKGPSQEMEAHIVCVAAAPEGSFVTYGPISGRYRVCVGQNERGKDLVWEGWPDWNFEEITTSIDAAVALVQHVLPGAMWAAGCMEGGPFCRLVYPTNAQDRSNLGTGWGHSVSMEAEGGPATVPLAICAALLTALLAQQETSDVR